MTSPPPPEGREPGQPTGPPSGPLSGSPSEPPHEPTRPWQQPEQPTAPGGPAPPRGPGDGGGGDGGGGPGDGRGDGRHWWRSAPRVAIIAGAVVLAVVLAVVFTRMGGGSGKGELFLQPAGAAGNDPFTESTAENGGAPASPVPGPPARGDGKVTVVEGSAPGLYGGSRDAASCDVEKQIRYLRANPDKARAFAAVQGRTADTLPAYLRSLTSVQLLADTRVTNHGYKDGRATGYQAVLQAGTAVMVDAYGVPRVRCACGNPLTPPVAIQGAPKPVGKPWPGYQPSKEVTVRRAPAPVGSFVLLDPHTGQYFRRPESDDGSTDTATPAPSESPFGPGSSSPSGSTSASPQSPSGTGGSPSGATSPGETPSGSPGSPGSPPAQVTPGPGTPQGPSTPPQPGTPGQSS
ncbi:DUF6777 domain-containing protein [Streptomyces sp. YGL11-2]|uniref:DUF6777 domain-containing protein n=1 Tax=Streptomyces sp. YGL11-2 TaxID=3414028 RepID=UPI003CEEEA2C